MNYLLSNILFKSKSTLQVWVSMVGVFFGLTALIISVLLYSDIKNFQNSDDELFGPNSVIIQKKVTKFTSIGLNSTEFSKEEIENLKNRDFIQDVAPFVSANYSVGISENPGDGLPPFYADMFFQSIPDKYIDVETNWVWSEKSDYVPIILPRDFLMLINYGISESQGMPQISEELLSVARLQIHMSGQGKKGLIMGKVVGFSHKISSILVPETFINYSNEIYGSSKPKSAQRLFITIEDGKYGELENLIEELNLDINKSTLDFTKIKTVVNIIIYAFFIAALLIVFLSVFSFIQYAQLVLTKASEEIIILFRQGYGLKQLLRVIVKNFSFKFGIITLFATLVSIIVKISLINPILLNNGIEVANHQLLKSIFIGLICLIGFVVINFVTTKKILFKLGNK